MCDVNDGQLERLFLHTVTRQVKKIGMKTTLQLGGKYNFGEIQEDVRIHLL